MWIKWLDKHGGAVKSERWEKIAEEKALEMLRRRYPKEFDTLKWKLHHGETVRADMYHVSTRNPRNTSVGPIGGGSYADEDEHF